MNANGMKHTIAAVWGVTGVILLLLSAILRLAPLAADALNAELQWYHWVTLVLVLTFMIYMEGYRAFQKGFSPRVAARARYLRTHYTFKHALLAPFFCMAYFHASKRRQLISLFVTGGIIVLVLLMRFLPQPWRGIVDAGVVAGLGWGLAALLVFSIQALTLETFDHSPDVPGREQ